MVDGGRGGQLITGAKSLGPAVFFSGYIIDEIPEMASGDEIGVTGPTLSAGIPPDLG